MSHSGTITPPAGVRCTSSESCSRPLVCARPESHTQDVVDRQTAALADEDDRHHSDSSSASFVRSSAPVIDELQSARDTRLQLPDVRTHIASAPANDCERSVRASSSLSSAIVCLFRE